MTNGTRPSTHIPRRKFHEYFGSVLNPDSIPDFCVDKGFNGMPDQDKDGAFTECTGYAAADILSDIYGRQFSPDFSYAANFYTTGELPTLSGASFTGALQGAIAVGGLPKELATITASAQGEMVVANWAAWSQANKSSALGFVLNGLYNVLNGSPFNDILSALYINRIAVSAGSPWFDEWVFNINGGVVQLPALDGKYPSWHDYNIKGKKTINGVPYLMVKSWQGTRVGDGGWLYFSKEVVDAALSVQGSGAITPAMDANRWFSILGILIQRFPALAGRLITLQ